MNDDVQERVGCLYYRKCTENGSVIEQSQTYNPINLKPQLPIERRVSKRSILFGRWYQRLMRGESAVGISLPNWFASNAVATYFVALIIVNVMFLNYGTEWYFMLFGIAWVMGFFYLSRNLSISWSVAKIRTPKLFEKKLFLTSFLIRAVYVFFSYFFYQGMHGNPFEFSAADSMGYTELAEDWALYFENDTLGQILMDIAQHGVSDMGFPLFLLIPTILFWEGAIIVSRLLSLLGAYTAVLIYRLARRSMDETTARISAIFCALHPVLICYAGMSLKEVLMTFLTVWFIERADSLLRNKQYKFGTVIPVLLIGLSLFFFRTVLGMVAFMAVLFSLLMIDTHVVSIGRKIAIGITVVLFILLAASDRIMNEVHEITNTDIRAQQRISMTARYGSEKGGRRGGGNKFANYAGAAVFAPLIFTIPFPTMVVAEGQEDMRLIHGGNWVRNIMSGLVILAMVMLLLSGDWRQYTLPLSMMLGYLVMLVFTQFAHSLRFHIPTIPFEMLFAAYALTHMRRKHKRWYLYWCLFMIVTCVAWNWFKLAGRGLV